MRLWKDHQLLSFINNFVIDYPSPKNLSYFWSYGLLSAFCLVIQLVSGIVLAMHYCGNVETAFESVEHIMRDVNYGWVLRYYHANGASMFFIMVYTHMFRGLYYSSFHHPRHLVWMVGVIILLLMVLTSFIGYVLPWGQMSFWGATVITNLCTGVPIAGSNILFWLWGGFGLQNATLNRFYSLHYLMPFLITALVVVHLIILHEDGSSDPVSLNSVSFHKIVFHRYFTSKDYLGVILLMALYAYFVFFNSNYLGHSDNYIMADPLKTPTHIVPEWYFLPFYAILRSIPNKLLGIIGMLLSILILLIIPFIDNNNIRNTSFRPLYRPFFWFFLFNCLILGRLGCMVIEYPYVFWSRLSTFFYFSHFLIIMPLISFIENLLISEDLYKKK